MSLTVADTVKKTGAQASRVTQGEALVVMIKARKLHRLNEVGTRIWQLCDGRDVASMVAVIVAEFDIEHDAAVLDVCAFLDELLTMGALERVPTPSTTGGT